MIEFLSKYFVLGEARAWSTSRKQGMHFVYNIENIKLCLQPWYLKNKNMFYLMLENIDFETFRFGVCFKQKRFYNRETTMGIRISWLAEIPPINHN